MEWQPRWDGAPLTDRAGAGAGADAGGVRSSRHSTAHFVTVNSTPIKTFIRNHSGSYTGEEHNVPKAQSKPHVARDPPPPRQPLLTAVFAVGVLRDSGCPEGRGPGPQRGRALVTAGRGGGCLSLPSLGPLHRTPGLGLLPRPWEPSPRRAFLISPR